MLKEHKERLLEKRQENEPVRERDRTAEGEAETQGDRKRRLLALNHPERGDTICTKDMGPPASQWGEPLI